MTVLQDIDTPAPLGPYFEQHSIAVKTWLHKPVFTVSESQEVKKHLKGAHTKNLFLKDKKKNLYLVVACDDTSVDLKYLSRRLSAARFSFGSPELLADVLGVKPGSVTPFALINDDEKRVNVVLDSEMMAYDTLNFHPLDNTMTTAIARDDLVKFIELTGHKAEIIDLE